MNQQSPGTHQEFGQRSAREARQWSERLSVGLRSHWLLGVVMLCSLLSTLALSERSARAETSFVVELPTLDPTRPPPWRAIFRSSSVHANGYRPFHVTLIPQAPSPVPTTRAQSLTVQIQVLEPYSGSDEGSLVTKTFEVPAGTDRYDGTLLVPVRAFWSTLELRLFADGKLVNKTRTTNATSLSSPYGNFYNEGLPSVLVVDSRVAPTDQKAVMLANGKSNSSGNRKGKGVGATMDGGEQNGKLPNLRTMMRVFGSFDRSNTQWKAQPAAMGGGPNQDLEPSLHSQSEITVAALRSLTAQSDRVAVQHPLDLPAYERPTRGSKSGPADPSSEALSWIALTSYDFIFISLNELQALSDQQPARFANLRRWVLAGQTLCVWGVGERFEELARLERLLRMGSRPGDAGPNGGWEGSEPISEKLRFQDLNDQMSPLLAQLEEVQSDDYSRLTPGPDWLRRRTLGLGLVVAMSPRNPFPGTLRGWDQLLGTVGQDRWRWSSRHGAVLRGENTDHARYELARVGEPPVVTFLVLNTLFAIVVGPLNYLVLKSRRRLYLLLITVPLAAAVVTGSLLSYALVSDGIHTRVRIFSTTYYDKESGEAIHWGRHCYYASFAPSAGLEFPEDAAVYPVYARLDDGDSDQRMNWDQQQNLQSGYLRSRTLSQFIAIENRAAKSPFVITPAAGEQETLTVQNNAGQPVLLILARDHQGRYYAGSLAADTTEQLQRERDGPGTLGLKLKLLWDKRQAYEANKGSGWRVQGNNRFGFRFMTTKGGTFNPMATQSILESHLNSDWQSRNKIRLEPGQFLAFVEQAPGLSLGMKGVMEEDSIHLLWGNW